MKKSRGVVVLILVAILTGLFCFTAAVGFGHYQEPVQPRISRLVLIWQAVSALHTKQKKATQAAKI